MARQGIPAEDVRAAIARKDLAPVYLFHGKEDFLIEEMTDAIIEAALARDERGFNLDVVYGSEADARDVMSHATSFPMMAQRRVVVVREVEKLPNGELLTTYIENPLPSTCLVLVSAKPDFRRKPYVTARRKGVEVEFKPLYDTQVPAWIVQRVKRMGKTFNTDASRLLAACTGTSLRDVQNEIDKLFIYVGERPLITEEDVRAIVGMSKEFNVFELQKALGAGDMARSVEILHRMLDAGESPTGIIVMLTRYFNSLWKLQYLRTQRMSSSEQASVSGINFYFLNEYVSALSVFSRTDIEGAFVVLAAADEELKTTSTDPRQVMQRLVINLLNHKELAYF